MRKVLSFVLVLTLVLSSFSMAFAANTTAAPAGGLTDIAGNANQDAIKVAYDLGIVTGNPDGTYLPAKAVTRAEFAALITRALDVPASALAGYTATSFKDTTGYGWAVPYLAFAQSKGIMLGDGNGNVMPGRTITVNEAMTMALRAIGYTANSSMLVGAWPANYVSIAQNNDLYDDVAAKTTVDKASAAQIVYNLLTVQKVSVNSDGETKYLTTKDDKAANLLNTNLGCTEKDNVVLGNEYDYDNSVINITDSIGAHGDAYLNDDGDLVAFTQDSTALTGKVNDDGDFAVGDTTYEFGANTITSAGISFVNTDKVSSNPNLTSGSIQTFAVGNSNDGDTVTLNVDLSGKKIKDIYSVSAWTVAYDNSDAAKAPSDVQGDIADKALLNGKFVENDNKEIDMNSFDLVGVASLDKIAKDNVLYVYTDGNGDIRKVEVGTKTVQGAVDEINTDDKTVTVAGTEYDMAPTTAAAVTILGSNPDIDEASEGTFYLDANGAIYDFDGSASTNTYAVVKAASAGDSFNNLKVKLYTSSDATSTYYLSENNATKIDWTTNSAFTVTNTSAPGLTAGTLVGYSLDNSGEVDAMNVTAVSTTGAILQSTKVLITTDGSLKINSDAVVFTYDADPTDAGSYDVSKLADVDTGVLSGTTSYILDSDGNVAALFIDETNANVDQDAIYGVFNKKYTTKDADDNTIFRFTGYVDGTAFSYKTADDDSDGTAAYNAIAGTFGVYKITLDSSSLIKSVDALTYSASIDGASAMVTNGAQTLNKLDDSNTLMTFVGGMKYTVADDAVVYKYDDNNDTFSVSKLSAIDDNDQVVLYDTKGDDANGIANVVIFMDK